MVEMAGHLALYWEAGTHVSQPGIYWREEEGRDGGERGREWREGGEGREGVKGKHTL